MTLDRQADCTLPYRLGYESQQPEVRKRDKLVEGRENEGREGEKMKDDRKKEGRQERKKGREVRE